MVPALLWSSALLISYVVLGYPAGQCVYARLRPSRLPLDHDLPSVSVLVPCHNEADVIAEKLKSVWAAAEASPVEVLEVIVVDDGSTDGTSQVVAQTAPAVRLLTQPVRAGKASAVNRGVAAACGDVVLLTDATAVFAEQSLAGITPFRSGAVGAVSGVVAYTDGGVAPVVRLYWRYEDAIRGWESRTGSTVGVNGNFFAFRRSLFRPLPPETVNDELTIALMIAAEGARVVFAPDAVTQDVSSPTMRAENERRSRMVAGQLHAVTRGAGRGVWRHPSLAFRLVSHKLLRISLPPAAAAHVAASLWLVARRCRRRTPTGLLAHGTVLSVCGIVTAAAEASRRERRGRPVPVALRLPQMLISSAWATAVGVTRQARGGQSVLWVTRRG